MRFKTKLFLSDWLLQARSVMFNDNVRSVDFVLAWLENKTTEDDEAEEKREVFEERLEEEGLELERERTDKLHIVKLHAPKEVLRRYAEILRLRMPMKEVHFNLLYFLQSNA